MKTSFRTKILTMSLILVMMSLQVVTAFCADFVASQPRHLATSTNSLHHRKKQQQQQQQLLLQQRYIQSQEAVLTVPHHMVLTHHESDLVNDTMENKQQDHQKVKDDDDDDDTAVVDTTEVVVPSKQRALVLPFALSTLAFVAMGAKVGFLEGYDSDLMILQDAGASILTGVLAYAFVKFNTYLVDTNRLESRDARKIIHSFSAPLFILCWPIFSNDLGARYFAGIVTMVNALRLILAAQGGDEEKSLGQTVSRSGNVKEALGGPFVYVIIVQLAIWLFWRSNIVGIIAVSTMAAGDGFADLIGRRYGQSNKWWFSPQKSIVGSLAFWIASTLCSVGLVTWLQFTGCLELPTSLIFSDLVMRIAGITFVSAFLELIPIGDDNWTVPISAAAMAFLFFR